MVLALTAVLASSALSACGSGTDSAEADSGALTVAVPVSRPVFGQLYLALELGYFEDEGLAVKTIDAAGANVTNLVASGKADIGMLGATGALAMEQQGRDTTIVYAHAMAGSAGSLVGGEDVASIDDLRGERIGALGQGTATYGFATTYNESLDLNADIVPFQDVSTLASALASGQVEGAVGGSTDLAQLVADGRATVLIDPSDPEAYRTYIGQEFPEGVTFGITDDIEGNSEAVVDLLRGFERARDYYEGHTDEEVAAVLENVPAFADFTEEDLVRYVANDRPFLAPNEGRIDESTWEFALDQYANWGIEGFDPDDAVFSYGERIDMSYLDEATQ